MTITVGNLLSLVIAATYTVIAVHWLGAGSAVLCIGLLVPLALIWFPDDIGNLTGYYKTGYVNVQTPGVMVSLVGWFFLVGLPILFYLLRG